MELVVDNVKKTYANVTAIKSLSLKVNEGEIFALLGPNGAGKSSLVRMLVGFTSPDSGQIIVRDGQQEHSAIPSHNLGYLPEDRGLYPEKSVMKNLLYFAQLHGVSKPDAIKEAEYWLERFDLSDRHDQPLKSLSKGNQQKVQLITAVLHKPKWVILDEPFSGLDPVNQEKVVQFLSELKAKGMTVLLSAHQMAMVEKLADRMLLMNKGEKVFYGSLEQIQSEADTSLELTAQYQACIDKEHAQEQLAAFELHHIDDEKIKVRLKNNQMVNELIDQLTKLGEIVGLQSAKIDLHQLYLNAIENHGAA